MKRPTNLHECACVAVTFVAVFSGADTVLAQQPAAQPTVSNEKAQSSVEQGQTPLTDSFESVSESAREWRLQKRRTALEATEFDINFRTFYFDRRKFDGAQSQAFTIGGWIGLKTGYFLDHIALGATGYTSQPLYAPSDKDGTLLLKPGQDGYTVLGEAYADIRIIDDLDIYVGRKGYDTPFINRNDVRMTPNTFEAIVLQGKVSFGADEVKESPGANEGKASLEANDGKTSPASPSAKSATLKYGAGYFDKIKERNSEEFVWMSKDAGANVNQGVYTAGAVYENGGFSIGAIDYLCPDVINIGYAEAKLKLAINDDWKPKFSAQFVDQRSVGDNALQGDSFSGQQVGIKAELPLKQALFSLAYTYTTDGTNMQSPWGGYPGYTSVQVQDFNRAGEGAFLVRAGYEFTKLKGLSAYALAVVGTDPHDIGQYRQNEYDANLQWAPPEGVLKGLSLRLRYALVQQKGGDVDNLKDFRVICNYSIKF